jgi:GLPGLI family protein
MKNAIYLFGVLTILFSLRIFAQDFTGSAIYKTDMKMEIKMDSTDASAGQMDLVQEQLRLAMQKDFELTFNKTESNWKELPKLDRPSGGRNGGVQIQIMGMGGGSDGLLYKNTKTKKSIESTDGFGKLFLVSDELEPVEWEMTSETKQIGKYICYKAISKREITHTVFSDVNGETEEKEEKKMQTTTVWYTPEIPVNHGPEGHWGLPGLILEVNNGSRIMICTKVVLNPEKPITIEIPTKGKKVNGEEYEVIMKEQAEKMNKMHGGGKKKGQNSSFEIRIGG